MNKTKEETWKEIPNTNGTYSASSDGQIRSNDRKVIYSDGREYFYKGKVLVPAFTTQGYLKVVICDSEKNINKAVHRSVAEAFIPNPNNLPCVCHKNDIKTDNQIENLFWGTVKDNCQDKVRKGRQKSGTRKLNLEQVSEIRELLKTKITQKEIAREFDISQSCISEINSQKSYYSPINQVIV